MRGARLRGIYGCDIPMFRAQVGEACQVINEKGSAHRHLRVWCELFFWLSGHEGWYADDVDSDSDLEVRGTLPPW